MWFGVPVENEQATSRIASHLTRKLLPIIQFEKLNRALCLLDPLRPALGLGGYVA
jgi:hypothetical protein